ncbi:MAG TPA: GNAT family N-acetyltransferase [Gaiellaceae bacterium]|nr:GNAT family N-acetyltransferase [Gaiellaceae bacterium]
MEIRTATPDDAEHAFELLSRRSRRAFGVSEVAREHVAQSLALTSTEGFVGTQGFASLDATQTIEIASIDDSTNDALYGAVAQRAAERGFDRLHAVVAHGDAPFDSLVRRAGFEHHGDVQRMWRRLDGDLPAPAWPEGAAVRTYTDADGLAVHALLDDAYRAWDETYVPRAHDDWLTWMTSHDGFDPALWFLVERGGELVACTLNWREEQRRGWVKDIVVRADARGQGLAKALLHHTFHAYAARAAEHVGLKVETANPTGALQLYDRVGFVTDHRYGIWVKVL